MISEFMLRKRNTVLLPENIRNRKPPIARAMLMALEFSPALTNRVCELVAHHHSYQNIDAVDLQILVEADFLVNAYEEGLPKRNIKKFRDKIFRTETGIHYLNELFALD